MLATMEGVTSNRETVCSSLRCSQFGHNSLAQLAIHTMHTHGWEGGQDACMDRSLPKKVEKNCMATGCVEKKKQPWSVIGRKLCIDKKSIEYSNNPQNS